MFLVLWACLANYFQSDTTILQKTFMFISRQKLNFIPHALMEDCKYIQTYFGYFGHAWLHSPKMIVFNVYLHAKNKLHNSLLSYNITF